jgi:pimeloyl-ACP methyl ester carboxylesterase
LRYVLLEIETRSALTAGIDGEELMGRVDVDGVGIDYEITGQGRPVVLLHSFPDSGRVWRHQVPALAGDVLAALADLEIPRAHLVGHDWGAAVAWVLASVVPDKVDHLAVLSVGHPATFLRTLEQRQLSWYMLLFQFTDVAERWLSQDNWAGFRAWSRHPDVDQVISGLDRTGSLTPGLNWYRAKKLCGGGCFICIVPFTRMLNRFRDR